jgi:flagellar protein FlaG
MNINTNGIGTMPVSVRRVGDDAPVGVGGGGRVDTAPVATKAKDLVRQEVPVERVRQAVASLNQAVQAAGSNLKFTVDEATHEPIVRVVDTETGQLIRQIPSKEALAIANSIDDFLSRGALLTQET